MSRIRIIIDVDDFEGWPCTYSSVQKLADDLFGNSTFRASDAAKQLKRARVGMSVMELFDAPQEPERKESLFGAIFGEPPRL